MVLLKISGCASSLANGLALDAINHSGHIDPLSFLLELAPKPLASVLRTRAGLGRLLQKKLISNDHNNVCWRMKVHLTAAHMCDHRK